MSRSVAGHNPREPLNSTVDLRESGSLEWSPRRHGHIARMTYPSRGVTGQDSYDFIVNKRQEHAVCSPSARRLKFRLLVFRPYSDFESSKLNMGLDKLSGLRGKRLKAAMLGLMVIPSFLLFGYNNGSTGGILDLESFNRVSLSLAQLLCAI